MILGLNQALNFSTAIVLFMIIMMILPYILGFFMDWIYAVLGFVFRIGYPKKNLQYKQSRRTTNIGRLVSFITLPGTLLRVMLVFLFLKLRGWELSISYPGVVGSLNRSISDSRRSGFFISMKPNSRRGTNFKEVVLVSLVGYIPMFVAYFMWISREKQIDFLIYLQQGNAHIIWIYVIYYYLLFAILIGGAPIPEETMLPVYYLIGRYPHLIVSIFLSYIISFLISWMEIGYLGFEGYRVARTYFLLFSTILFFGVVLNERELKLTRKGLDDKLLEMEVVDLL